MKKNIHFILFGVFFVALQGVIAQVTLRIPGNALPQLTPIEGKLYVAGSFNNWNAANTASQLLLQPDGSYAVTLSGLTNGTTVEYKFTRGNWDFVETLSDGSFLTNRTLTVTNGTTSNHAIANWDDVSTPGVANSSKPNVRILNAEFNMPELGNKKRRIWVSLPPDYNISPTRRYPVMYMHDGQNLFDNATSFSGEWAVDDSLDALFAGGDAGIIVVGIDNGGADRLNEYSPWVNTQYGGGDGDQYIDFLVNTLKPHIDNVFRTKPGREYTAIGGSSMGGLISMYGGIERQDIFSKLLIFSPSFWFSSQCFSHVTQKGKQFPMRIYMMCGTPEGNGSVQQDLNTMKTTLLAAGFSTTEINYQVRADGQHSEWFWRREFPDAYKWLFDSQATAIHAFAPENTPFYIVPVPVKTHLDIVWENATETYNVAIFNSLGQNVLFSTTKGNQTFDFQTYPKGVYLLIVEYQGKTYRKKILKE